MRGSIQFPHSFDGDLRCTRALDMSAHFVEHFRQITDFGLACSVLKHRLALSKRGGHHQVLRSGHGDLIEKDVSSRQAFRRCLDVTVRGPNNSAKFLKSVNVKIDWPRTARATARQ